MTITLKLLLIVGAMIVLLIAVAVFAPVSLLNALTPASTFTLTSNVVYEPTTQLKLDIYRPKNAQPTNPVIVFFYGGSWNRGSRGDYRFAAAALTARGFVVVIPDYRLYPQVRYPQFLEDCATAVAWTKHSIAEYGGDAQRIYLLGHSAGAYNAAMLALDPRWLNQVGLAPSDLKGWAGLAGPYHFLPSNNPDVQPVFMHPNYPPNAQPIEHVREATLPAFIGAAGTDNLVDPQQNSGELARALQARAIPTSLKFYPGVNHLTLMGAFAWPLRGLAPVLDDVVNYFQQIP
ncbi:MAG: esterase [Verrucomicrobiaceae bacterium]|nr:esterase [Verrucomicrobiaceae bacterium]